MILQIFFFAAQLYGWWNWARHPAAGGGVSVVWLASRQRILWGAGCIAATLFWGAAMSNLTDAALPWLDAANLILSMAAQVLMSQRYSENWVLWIAVDALSVIIYFFKDLWAFFALYVILTGLAAWGFVNWRRAEVRERVVAA